MAPGWRFRRERRENEEGALSSASNGQRGTDAGAGGGFGDGETSTGNFDAPLPAHDHHHDDDDDAPESLDFQNIYNAAFELRRSSLDPGRRAAFFEPAPAATESGLDPDDAVAAVSAAEAAETDAAAVVLAGDGSPVVLVAGSGGDTSAELKLRGKPFLGIKPHTLFKLAATAAIGLGMGCLAASLGAAVDKGLHFRNATVHTIVRSGGFSHRGVALAALFAASWAALLTSVSALLVATFAPVAGGSGVSLVMAYLNGNAVPRLLDGRTLTVKWIGTGLSVASGITLGLEAPLVHLGACMASLCADAAGRAWEGFNGVAERVDEWRWERRRSRSGVGSGEREREQEQPLLVSYSSPSSSREEAKRLRRSHRRFIPILQSDAERREFVSAGVAAGLAAAFGAPIGGVLFAMEEASTHWSRKVGWRAFLAATATAVALNQLYPRAFGVLQFAGVAPLSALEWAHQLPLLALVGALGGLMGAGFQALHRAAARRVRRGRKGSNKKSATAAFVFRAAATSAAIVLAMFALSLVAGTCVEVPEWRDKGYGFVLTCRGETYNDLATLFFSPAADTASHIFSSGALTPRFNVCSHGGKSGGGRGGETPGGGEDDSCYFTLRSLALLCPTYLVSMAASSATGIPGGLFLPSIVAGGSFGGTAGLLLARALPAMRLQAGLFAMVGATAALGGVFRASVALVVLVVEGTQSVRFLLAIAVAAIAANWAGDLCRPGGVYESDLEADGRVVFLRPTPPPALHFRTAGSVAARGVWAFREVESVAYVLDVLSRTKHNGFPVVRAASSQKKERTVDKALSSSAASLAAAAVAAAAAAEQEEEGEDGGSSKGGVSNFVGGDGASSSSSPPPSPERSAPSATTTEPETTTTTAAPISSAAATSSREGVLVGLVLRSQLLVLLRARFFCDERGRPIPRAAADAVVSAAAAAAAASQQEGGGEGGAATAPAAAEAAAASEAPSSLSSSSAAAAAEEDHHHDVFALDSAMRSFFRLSGAPTRRAASLAPALSAAFSRRRATTTAAASGGASSSSPSSSSAALALAAAPHPPTPPRLPPPPSLAEFFIDLRPFMDRAPLSVRPECPAERAHAAFVALGLRHLPLTTAEGLVCGMLTRKDLDAAAGAGPWRRSKIAPAPAPPPPGGLHVPSEFVGSRAPGRGAAREAGGGGIRRRARDFAAAAAAAGSAVWNGNNSNGSSGNLQNQQQQQQQGGGDERV